MPALRRSVGEASFGRDTFEVQPNSPYWGLNGLPVTPGSLNGHRSRTAVATAAATATKPRVRTCFTLRVCQRGRDAATQVIGTSRSLRTRPLPHARVSDARAPTGRW